MRFMVALCGLVVGASVLPAQAQQRPYRLGTLLAAPSSFEPALVQALADRGDIEGKNIERRYSEGRRERLPGLGTTLPYSVQLQASRVID